MKSGFCPRREIFPTQGHKFKKEVVPIIVQNILILFSLKYVTFLF